jgi:hypothetical protein
MILFLDEDRAYLNWVTHHRTGFVLDCLRHPTKTHLVLHRATCPEIKRSESKRTHWTTGKHMKGCSIDLGQLQTWAKEQTEHDPTFCPQCSPQLIVETEHHLTKLDRDILDFVLEIAAAHMDDDERPYALNVGMVARCLDKTEGQLAAAFGRLVEDGMLSLMGKKKPGETPSPQCGIFPTAKSLRTLPFFASLDDSQIDAELGKLGTAID